MANLAVNVKFHKSLSRPTSTSVEIVSVPLMGVLINTEKIPFADYVFLLTRSKKELQKVVQTLYISDKKN